MTQFSSDPDIYTHAHLYIMLHWNNTLCIILVNSLLDFKYDSVNAVMQWMVAMDKCLLEGAEVCELDFSYI